MELAHQEAVKSLKMVSKGLSLLIALTCYFLFVFVAVVFFFCLFIFCVPFSPSKEHDQALTKTREDFGSVSAGMPAHTVAALTMHDVIVSISNIFP